MFWVLLISVCGAQDCMVDVCVVAVWVTHIGCGSSGYQEMVDVLLCCQTSEKLSCYCVLGTTSACNGIYLAQPPIFLPSWTAQHAQQVHGICMCLDLCAVTCEAVSESAPEVLRLRLSRLKKLHVAGLCHQRKPPGARSASPRGTTHCTRQGAFLRLSRKSIRICHTGRYISGNL